MILLVILLTIFHRNAAVDYENGFQLEVEHLKANVLELQMSKTFYSTRLDRLIQKLEFVEKELAQMKEDNSECFNQQEKQSDRKRLLMTNQPPLSSYNHVAFYAQLTKNLQHLTTNQIVLFDNVQLNHGNSYSSLDGEFVCTVPGTYAIFWTITCSDNTAIETELVVNGNVKGHFFTDAGNHADYETNSGTAVLQLNVGDRVFIRVGHVYNGQIIGTSVGSSTFSGFLVNPGQ